MSARLSPAQTEPELLAYRDDGRVRPVLCWRFASPRLAISSGPLGGLGQCRWLLNATVPTSYRRTDPDAHLAEIAAQVGLRTGAGMGMLTAVDVARQAVAADSGVLVSATVGLSVPTWAAAGPGEPGCQLDADPSDDWPDRPRGGPSPGTINVVVQVPARLSEPALINAVATVAEAKAQALWECGIAATGTASDATCVVCPTDGPAQPFGGPRSVWGSRLARAVHAAVGRGTRAWLTEAGHAQRAGRSVWLDAPRPSGQVASKTPCHPYLGTPST